MHLIVGMCSSIITTDLNVGQINFTLNYGKSDVSITFKETLGILLIQGEQLSGSFADLCKSELHPPHFSLVSQSILTYGD